MNSFMKKKFAGGSIAALIFFVSIGTAQNLVLNPGLEDVITCPGFGQFDSIYVSHWTKPSWGSTDYYHDSCAGIEPVSQIPHGGSGYLGIIAYNYGTEYREYATAKLSTPLEAGAVCEVAFYVSLNDGYIQAVNEVGAWLSTSAPGPYANSLHIPVTPQIQNTSGVLSSITSWMLVSGTFTAAGGEQYITIGNFNDDSSTTISQVGSVGSYGAYYFVDDVSVIKGKGTGIPLETSPQLSIAPNPSSTSFTITVNSDKQEDLSLRIFDATGRIVQQYKISNQITHFTSGEDLLPGIYLVELSQHGYTERVKWIKIK